MKGLCHVCVTMTRLISCPVILPVGGAKAPTVVGGATDPLRGRPRSYSNPGPRLADPESGPGLNLYPGVKSLILPVIGVYNYYISVFTSLVLEFI